MLRPEELRALSAPSPFRSTLAIVIDWVLIALNFTVAALFPNPLVWVLCFIFAARQQLALAILMHDGSHRRLFKSFKVNDIVGQWTCAAPLFFSMFSYQKLHLKHHRDPLVADDPDLSLTGGYPISRSSFLRKLMRDATGISYFKFIRYFIYMARKPKSTSGAPKQEKEVGPQELKSQASGQKLSLAWVASSILLVNIALWAVLFATGHGWLYLFFWVIPAVTALQVLLRIRGVAEHAGYAPNSDQRLNSRTVLNPWQTLLFAPHNVAYHIEHHVYPSVPCHNLPKLHAKMQALGMLPEDNVFHGYGEVLKDLILPKV